MKVMIFDCLILKRQFLSEGRRRLFIDSPQQKSSQVVNDSSTPVTPRKASGVIKQLFASPSSSLKRTHPSPHAPSSQDKRPRLF